MRFIAIIFFFFYLIILGCHTPKGTYCSPPNYTGSCIEFLNSREFINYGFTDYGSSSMNYGKFYKIGNRLILRYKKIPEKHKYKSKSFFNLKEIESKSDSIHIKVFCFELDSTRINSFNYKLSNLKTDSILLYRNKYVPLEKGFKWLKQTDSLKLNVNWFQSKNEIRLSGQKSYQIDLYLENIGKLRYNSHSGRIEIFKRKKEEGKRALVRKNSRHEYKLFEKSKTTN